MTPSGLAFEEHRRYLFSVAYRLLSSVADAEDAVQESYLRWAQADQSRVRDVRAFLATVVVRVSLNQLRSTKARREVYVGPWLPEPFSADDLAEPAIMRESLSLAFLYVLESLAPLERAVFILREVFEYGYPEIAAMVEKSEANCRQLFHRAQDHLASRRARYSAPDAQRRRVTEQFLQATSNGNVSALMALLAEDVTFVGDSNGKVQGAGLRPVSGRDNVTHGFMGNLVKFPPDQVWIQDVNGRPALVASRGGQPYGVLELEVDAEGLIRGLYAVLNPDKLRRIVAPWQ